MMETGARVDSRAGSVVDQGSTKRLGWGGDSCADGIPGLLRAVSAERVRRCQPCPRFTVEASVRCASQTGAPRGLGRVTPRLRPLHARSPGGFLREGGVLEGQFRSLACRLIAPLLLASAVFLGVVVYTHFRKMAEAMRGFRWPFLAPAMESTIPLDTCCPQPRREESLPRRMR